MTAKKNLAIIVFTALGILVVCLVYLDILFGRWPAPAYSRPIWVLSFSITVGIMLLSLGYALKTRKMAKKKLTAKKVLAIVVLTALGTVAFVSLYFIILFFSLPFTGNVTVSWILSLSITFGILLALAYALKTRKKRGS